MLPYAPSLDNVFFFFLNEITIFQKSRESFLLMEFAGAKREQGEVTYVQREGQAWQLRVTFAERVPAEPTFSIATGYFC